MDATHTDVNTKIMERKRIVYLTLSVLSIIIPFALGFKYGFTITIILTIPIYILIQLLYVIVELFIKDYVSIHIFPTFGIISLFMKRIYYSEIGNFYCFLIQDEVHIYEQTPFMLKKVCSVRYYNDIEELNNRIKKEIESSYKEVIYEKRRLENFKKWDGYIDIESKREDKIKNIIK